MPLYEYTCGGCGKAVEVLVRRSGDVVQCPACGGASLERQLSTFAPGRAGPDPCGGCASSGGCPSAGAGACGAGMCGLN